MKIVGFNFKKLEAEKKSDRVSTKPTTSIEFTDLNKETADFLKDGEIIKFSFKYSVTYDNKDSKKSEGEVNIEGSILVSVSEEESKTITKDWKKKKLPGNINLVLFNLILKRCTPKAIALEDEVSLPFHIPTPSIQPKKEE